MGRARDTVESWLQVMPADEILVHRRVPVGSNGEHQQAMLDVRSTADLPGSNVRIITGQMREQCDQEIDRPGLELYLSFFRLKNAGVAKSARDPCGVKLAAGVDVEAEESGGREERRGKT
ncbi:hypothetical protein R1sor_002022 [Riccia sorocarpa]|uniref:Uncharacterized protein n=1 Tax=Riccia sorocarpa TaxID=122646 RepID=A0ABD3GXL6_9MARC